MEELILKPKWFKIGKKRYNVAWISAERALKAAAMFNEIDKGNYDKKTDKYIKYPNEYEMVKALLSVVFMLIKIDFKITNWFEWGRRAIISKKHILKTVNHKDIMDFVETAIEPIIGDKKKALEREQKTTDAMLILMDKMSPELLADLLLSYVPEQAIKKSTA